MAAGEGRRVSLESSVVTDVSGIPSITEDEIAELSLEQLEGAAQELQALCSLLQAELDLFNRFLSSHMVQEDAQPHLTPTASGSGTASPTISSLDVRGLWHSQVITKGRRDSFNRLSEREKCQLWQRELEIVQANCRKQEKQWQQELHKYEVLSLEAEARVKELQKSQQELMQLAEGRTSLDSPRTRLTFHHLHRFMEQQVRGRLKQVSHVWMQVALLKTNLSKLRAKLGQGRESQDVDPEGHPTSQVNFLKRQLEHGEAKTQVEQNTKELSHLLQQLERERRRSSQLQEENQVATKVVREVKREATVLEGQVLRLAHITSSIAHNLHLKDVTIHKQLTALNETPHQDMTVEQYLSLAADVQKLQKELVAWRSRARALQ